MIKQKVIIVNPLNDWKITFIIDPEKYAWIQVSTRNGQSAVSKEEAGILFTSCIKDGYVLLGLE